MDEKNLRLWKFLMGIFITLVFASFASSQEKASDIKIEAKQYIESNELRLQQTADTHKQFEVLIYLTPAALAAGNTEKAQNYAQELMTVADKLQSQPGFGPARKGLAIHISNLVRGHIALEAGNIDAAKEYLLAAGRVTGKPPILTSFGPDMLLAKQLIEKGARDAAIEYFNLCSKFWKNHKGRLEEWKNAVNKGEMPNFGAKMTNSLYTWRFAQ